MARHGGAHRQEDFCELEGSLLYIVPGQSETDSETLSEKSKIIINNNNSLIK